MALLAACLAAGCSGVGDEARREYYRALELSKTGQPWEEQLAHTDRAVRLAPTSALYVEHRANLLFSLGRLPEARADYDRAVELADRPYLRFERADMLCALGEYDAALEDLDRAIALQPENTQFYPRRALARLASGQVAAARADVDHAMASSRPGFDERYSRAAVLLMEGNAAAAVPDLDFAIASFSDVSDGALPRTLRLLAHAALDRRELAAAEFDPSRLAGEAYWPYRGYRYWLVPRGCANAFIATQANDLVSKALAILAATEPPQSSAKPPVPGAAATAEPALPEPPAAGSPAPSMPSVPVPVAAADAEPIVLLDYLQGGENPIRFSLNPKDLSAVMLEAIEHRKEVWLWTQEGPIPGVVDSVERNDQWKTYRGGLILNVKTATSTGPAKEGWAVLSFQRFPAQGWVSVPALASDKARVTTGPAYEPGRLTLEKFQAREHQYLIANYRLPCPDGGQECGDYDEVETTVYEGSSEAGWNEIDSFVDGGSRPFVDIDGDGIPEFVGSTGYKGYVLRRVLPERGIVFTSNSGV